MSGLLRNCVDIRECIELSGHLASIRTIRWLGLWGLYGYPEMFGGPSGHLGHMGIVSGASGMHGDSLAGVGTISGHLQNPGTIREVIVGGTHLLYSS